MKTVYAYIDETGDRGSGAGSSPIFGMAAVLVSEDDAPRLRAAVDQLRQDLRVPDGKVLSWKKYAKTHDRRKRAAEVLAEVQGIRVCYVYARKADLSPNSYAGDPVRFYDYVAERTYLQLLWAATYSMGADRVHVRFGHVRGHDQEPTKVRLQELESTEKRFPKIQVVSLRWVSADLYRESQAADLFGGFLKAAVWPSGEFNSVEAAYLLRIWPLIRKSESCVIPLGIFSMPSHDVLTEETWFPCDHCEKSTTPGTSTGRST